MPMPAWVARRRTVATSQASSALAGWVITWAPVERLAMNLDMASEISEPPKPRMAAKTSSPTGSWPVLAMYWSMPSRRMDTEQHGKNGDIRGQEQKDPLQVASPGQGDDALYGTAAPLFQGRRC